MIRFSDYYLMREDEEKKGLADIDAMPNEDELLLKVTKLAISRHQDRLIEFLNALAKHDDDIKNILSKYREKKKNYLPQDLRVATKEKDIVAPSMADSNGPI